MKRETQPHCRWCGKNLQKDTKTFFVVADLKNHKAFDGIFRYVQGPVKSAAEAQRLVNGTIVKVSYKRPDHEGGLNKFNVWDGMSYKACWGFFCTNNCAAAMGQAACKHPHSLFGPGALARDAQERKAQA
jgi:hypothetical protein